ncbi:MAG TPA: DNA polymerase IV, partial [Deinococcales bacterium]|nr:DNA polymerase IV [Deinococcales bacterium]
MTRWPRAILHVDMDAFYASVEQRENPDLRGKPVVVGADPRHGSGRGVVSAASYEARAFGVRSAMPVVTAYRLCPQAVFLPVRMSLYASVSRDVRAVFESFTPLIEPLSIDEAFLDVTASQGLFGPADEIARKVRAGVREATGLSCSAGVSTVKFVAKIASDQNKPDGLTVVPPGTERDFLAPLPVGRLWGVGPKLAAALEGMGVRRVGDIARRPREDFERRFGSAGAHVWRLSQAVDPREVVVEHEAKSVSQETTFPRDTLDEDLLRRSLLQMVEGATARARKGGIVGKTVVLKIRFAPFDTHTRQAALPEASHDVSTVYEAASKLLEAFFPLGVPVRLLGVGLKNLEDAGEAQHGLFSRSERLSRLDASLDQIRSKHGRSIVKRAR